MKINELKNKIIGKQLKTIINLNITNELEGICKYISNNDYEKLDSLHLLVFENNIEMLFIDYDSDGYRSGNWHFAFLQDVLDKNNTKDIKNINSIVRDIVYMEIDEKNYYMITTDEYIIMLGQNNTDSYYPSNFLDIEETKQKAILDKKLKKGELIEKD